jgi:hypothetical protein
MFGCLGRIGCAAVGIVAVAALAGGAYYTRQRWVPLVTPGRGTGINELAWAPLTPDGARRARTAIARLSSVDGPVFSNVPPADLAAFVLDSAAVRSDSAGRGIEAALRRDRILLRTRIRIGDLGADNVPLLGGVSNRTATVVIGGTLAVGRPGFGEWRIASIDVDAISVPGWALSRVTRALARYLGRERADGGAVLFTLPEYVGDVRIGESAVTLYKAVQ